MVGGTVAAGTRYLVDVWVSSAGITGWLKDNALPLIIFVIGLGCSVPPARATPRVLLTVVLVIVSLAVVAIGLDSSGWGSASAAEPVGVQNTPTAPTATPATRCEPGIPDGCPTGGSGRHPAGR